MDLNVRLKFISDLLPRIKQEGHAFLDIYYEPSIFCFLCEERFDDEEVLRLHLKDLPHMTKETNLNLNLTKCNVWPFNDGSFFFHDAYEKHKRLQELDSSLVSGEKKSYKFGKISARFGESDGVSRLHSIWCEWLGNSSSDDSLKDVAMHKFSIRTFPYQAIMRQRSKKEEDLLGYMKGYMKELARDSVSNEEESQSTSEDDPDEANEEESQSTSEDDPDEAYESHLLNRVVDIAFTHSCKICGDEMIANKDVGALLNNKSWEMVCTERYPACTGIYHVFHLSCLIRWILICEAEAMNYVKESSDNRGKRPRVEDRQSFPVFCPDPECDEEGPLTSKISEFKRKLNRGVEEWKKAPDLQENSSIGLSFPREGNSLQESVSSLKLLRFIEFSDFFARELRKRTEDLKEIVLNMKEPWLVVENEPFIRCCLCDKKFRDESSLRYHLSGSPHKKMNLLNTWPYDIEDYCNPIPITIKKFSRKHRGIGIIGTYKDGVNTRIWCEWIKTKTVPDQSPEYKYRVQTYLYHPSLFNGGSNKCIICKEVMILEKSIVATLIDKNNKKNVFVCSSVTPTEPPHVYHVRCLVHWILACELKNNFEDLALFCPRCKEESSFCNEIVSRIEDGWTRWSPAPQPSFEKSSVGLSLRLLPHQGASASHEGVSSPKFLNRFLYFEHVVLM